VVDTGFGYEGRGQEAKLCKTGHKNFSGEIEYTMPGMTKVPVPLDKEGHGTNVVGVIESYAKKTNVDYCIIIIKYYSGKHSHNNVLSTINSFNYADKIKADFINYSSGGDGPYPKEKEAVERYLNHGGHLVVAAGNDDNNLDLPGSNYYPAKYDRRITVVGALSKKGLKLWFSNFGSIVNRWELGEDVPGYGLVKSGTSQATAISTGKMVSETKNKCVGK
jgi:hypothetical protein